MAEEIKVGDIILIDEIVSNKTAVGRHSFVVIEDKNGELCGLNYDFIALIMSSFKDEEQKKKKLKFPGNFPISADSEAVKNGHGREGFIKAEQFYYFAKSKTSYRVIGKLTDTTLTAVLDFISRLKDRGIAIDRITDNL